MSRARVAISPAISVVIPVRDEAARIEACIRGILAQTIAVREVIVLDSGSTDGTLEILARFPEVRVIAIDPAAFNHGETRNVGVRAASSEWVLLTVGDARAVDTQWIERLTAGVLDDAVVGVCGAQVVPHDPAFNPVEWFRPVGEPQITRVQFASPEAFDRLSPAEKLAAASWDDVTALYRRDVLLALPFQRTSYAEDAIWARDALRAGHALVYNPAARVYHHHFETTDFAFKRALTTMYFRYRAFGFVYDEPQLILPLARAYRVLAREPAVAWRERFRWLGYTARNQLALRRAVRMFRAASRRGPATLDALHERCCGQPPIPSKTSPVAISPTPLA